MGYLEGFPILVEQLIDHLPWGWMGIVDGILYDGGVGHVGPVVPQPVGKGTSLGSIEGDGLSEVLANDLEVLPRGGVFPIVLHGSVL